MKNYYEILQVNEKATKEIISKVYKVLAKKYHPDANPDNKEIAAEKFKEISEAYEILSDNEKRADYDENLKHERESKTQETVSIEEFKALQNYCKELERKLNINKTNDQNTSYNRENTNNYQSKTSNATNYEYQRVKQRVEKQAYHDAVEKAYKDAYVNNLKNMGYTIKYKKTFKETIKGYFALAVTILIVFAILKILWAIPFIREWFIGLFRI